MTANLRFGSFELRPASRQLLVGGKEVELGARAFDVLHALIERRERVVTKQELLDLAWPGVVVEENNLHVQISTLRKILGQNAIVTVQGRGYRFTLEVAPIVALPSQVSTSRATSVAVARLIAPDNNPEATRHAADLTRDLVARLGRIRGYTGQMRVLAFEGDLTNDVTELGEQGRELHARYVVAGNVLRSVQGYAISVRLIDATSDTEVWSYQDTLKVESSTTGANLTRRVRAAIINTEMQRVLGQPLSTLSAKELALRALATWKKESMTLPTVLEAHRLATRALELEPDLVSALLIRVYLMDQAYGLDPKADRRRIVREIDNDTARALKLDPANETAWAWRAFAQLYLGRWDAAFEAIDRAIELDPENCWLLGNRALLLNVTGHPAEGLAAIDRAQATDPSDSAQAALVACHSHLLLGQFERAATMGEKCAVFGRVWSVQVLLVAAYANQGDWAKANAAKGELLRFVPDFTIAQARAYDEPAHPDYAKLAEKYIWDGLRKAGIPEQLCVDSLKPGT